MEMRINFVEFFETEIVLSILSKLDDPIDLIRSAAVSHSWRHFVIINCLSKNLSLRKAPTLIANIDTIIEQEEGTLTMDCRSGQYPLSFDILKKDHRMYCYVLEALSLSLIAPKNCIECIVGASSTDHYPAESVVNILVSIDKYPWGASYWSSRGHNDPGVPESILFKLNGGICIIAEIDIRPFECFFKLGNPIYSAKSVRFRMGHHRSNGDLKVNVESLPLQHLDDDSYVWSYTSPEFPMRQESHWRYLKIELDLKKQKKMDCSISGKKIHSIFHTRPYTNRYVNPIYFSFS